MSRLLKVLAVSLAVAAAIVYVGWIGLSLIEGVNIEKSENRYDQKCEFFDTIAMLDYEKAEAMLIKHPWLANAPLAENEEEFGLTLCDDTPLIASGGRAKMMRLLLSYGADVNAKTPFTGRYALTVFLAEGGANRYADADLLVSRGADVTITDGKHGNIAHAALSYFTRGSESEEKALLGYVKLAHENGLSFEMPDCDASEVNSLLGLAAKNGHHLAAKYLINELGFDPNAPVTADNKTPVMLAGLYGGYQTVNALLEVGADMNIKDDGGKSGFDYAGNSHKP